MFTTFRLRNSKHLFTTAGISRYTLNAISFFSVIYFRNLQSKKHSMRFTMYAEQSSSIRAAPENLG